MCFCCVVLQQQQQQQKQRRNRAVTADPLAETAVANNNNTPHLKPTVAYVEKFLVDTTESLPKQLSDHYGVCLVLRIAKNRN